MCTVKGHSRSDFTILLSYLAGLGKCVEIQPLSAVCEDSDLENAEVSLGKVCSLQGLGMFTRFETSTKYSLLHAILIYCCDPAVTGS